MRKGPIIQFRTREIPMWIHSCLEPNIFGSLSYSTLVRTGHIIIIKPIAMAGKGGCQEVVI
jgi:hypothetical protein